MPVQRVALPLIGDSSGANSERQDSGRSVNLLIETVNGKPALRASPGYFTWATAANLGAATGAVIRGMYSFQNRFFVVAGNKVLELQRDLTLNNWSSTTTLATLASTSGRVGLSYNNGYLIIGDGAFWTLNLDTKVLAPVMDDSSTDAEQILGFYTGWLDGTQLYFERDSSKYWYSDINNPVSVIGTSFFSAEFNPDNTLAAHVVNAEIVILGEHSTEWHWDSGDADNPFQRISGGHSEYGCVGRWANCRYGDTVAMVGRGPQGQGKVYLIGGAGSAPLPISTPAVEKAIEKVLFSLYAVTDGITMYAYQDAGHDCLVLNLPAANKTANNPAQPSMTWVYDRSTDTWHEHAYNNAATGLLERGRSDHHVLYNGRHYTGDYTSATIYEMAHDYFRQEGLTEPGDPLIKRRTLPRLYMNGQPFSIKQLEIRGDTGSGRDGNAIGGKDPQIVIRYRWDGKPWSNEVWRSWGKLGETDVRALFGPMGQGIDFELEVACAEPIHFIITSGWADVVL